jgi:hypothetical protein
MQMAHLWQNSAINALPALIKGYSLLSLVLAHKRSKHLKKKLALALTLALNSAQWNFVNYYSNSIIKKKKPQLVDLMPTALQLVFMAINVELALTQMSLRQRLVSVLSSSSSSHINRKKHL